MVYILHFVEEYYDMEVFPSKSRWKSIVKLAIKEVHENGGKRL